MKGINTKKVLDKFKGKKKLYDRVGGGSIIGQVIDSENRLVYVVEEGGTRRLSYAEDEEVKQKILHDKGHRKLTKISFEEILKRQQKKQQQDSVVEDPEP